MNIRMPRFKELEGLQPGGAILYAWVLHELGEVRPARALRHRLRRAGDRFRAERVLSAAEPEETTS